MGQGPGTKRHNAQRKAKARTDGQKYLRMRARGWSITAIAEHFNVAKSTVSERISEELKAPAIGVEEVRTLELTKCDDRERVAHLVRANSQDGAVRLKALAELHRIAERRAKLLGLDAPVRSIQTEEELETAMNKLRDRLPAEVFEQVVAILADVSVQHGEGQQDGAGRAPVSGGDRGTEGGPKGA